MKPKELLLLTLIMSISVFAKSQELNILHHVSSEQVYRAKIKEGGDITIYLYFYEPGIIDYKKPAYYLVAGWYQTDETDNRKNLLGLYYPNESLKLYVPSSNNFKSIEFNESVLGFDTTEYLECFLFPLNEKTDNSSRAYWQNHSKRIEITNIPVDERNRAHKIYLTENVGGDRLESIDVTDFVLAPFGENNIFIEDFYIEKVKCEKDSAGNWNLLLFLMNEYAISSLSSGGYFYLKVDKNKVIRQSNYVQTFRHGKFNSFPDNNFQSESKKRYLIRNWNGEKVLGSFYIDNTSIEVEQTW